MRICYISYYPSRNYPRQIQFIEALKSQEGDNIIITNSKKGFLGYLEVLGKYIRAIIRYKIETIVLGFRTTELFFLLYLLSPRKRIIYDCFVPLYPAVKHENKWNLNRILKNLLSPIAYRYEKLQVKLSDTIITDTVSHADLIQKLYNPKGNVIPVYLGNPVSIQSLKASMPESRKFKIFYYGTGQILHGTHLIIEALEEVVKISDIQCTVVGKIPAYLKKSIASTNSISHHLWKEQSLLFQEAIDSDLCIGGPFGNTFQSQNVITGKTFQFLSLAKCTLVGSNSETKRFNFQDKVNCLIIDQGSKEEIVKGIQWAYSNRAKLKEIGSKGRILFENHFSPIKLGNDIKTIVN